MRTRTLLAGLAAAAVLTAGAVYAQPYGSGWMMGGNGPGWMMNGGGYGGGYGPGPMMNNGGGYGPGMMGGYGGGPGYGGMMGNGYGPGYHGGYGPGWMHGNGGQGYARDLDLSTDAVKAYLAQMIRNPRLKVGEVKQADDDTITAEIVTKDKDALVQRFTVNRHTGFWRPTAD